MKDPRLLRILHDVREDVALRAPCDPPAREAFDRAMARLEPLREVVPRQELLDMDGLIERLTGCRSEPR